MRPRLGVPFSCLLFAACTDPGLGSIPMPVPAEQPDAPAPAQIADAPTVTGADAPVVPPPPPMDGGTTADAPPPPPPVPPLTPSPMTGLVILSATGDYQDVSADQGGNVWAVTPGNVQFFRAGDHAQFTFDQTGGLAHGQTIWQDTYYCDGCSDTNPGPTPVRFVSVAGGASGQAFVGNI